jgi:hypothetical protein
VVKKVQTAVDRVCEQAEAVNESSSILGEDQPLDTAQAQTLMEHPLPHWVERMTLSYLAAYGGKAERKGRTWNLKFPDGEHLSNVVFTAKDAEAAPSAQHLTLEHPRIRGLATRLPRVAEGQPIPCLAVPGLSADVCGVWSLWRIAIQTADWQRQRMLPLFVHDDGRLLQPTARHIWEVLLAGVPATSHYADEVSKDKFSGVWEAAERQGRSVYEDLVQQHEKRLAQDRERGEYALAARRRIVQRIGLAAVRAHRLAELDQEERAWREQLQRRADAQPEMVPLLLVAVKGGQ